MYSLLVVDDEKHYTDSLADTIPWAAHGIGSVWKAYSASQALKLIDERPVDILLTDIRMPVMSGLELIEEARRRKPGIQCLLLTGHADFGFAKKAIELQALDYLLKPVKDEQLVATVRNAVTQLEKERRQLQAHTVYRDNLLQLKGSLLFQCLQRTIAEEPLKEKLWQYDIPIAVGGSAVLCLVQLGEPFASYDLHSCSLLQFAAANIMEELLKDRYELWFASDEDGSIAMLIFDHTGAPVDLGWVGDRVEQFRRETRLYLKGEIAVALGGECCFPAELHAAYLRAKSGLTLPAPEAASRQGEEQSVMKKLYEPPLLANLLETGQWEEAERKLRSVLVLLRGSGPGLLRDVYFYLSSAFLYLTHKHGKSLTEMMGADNAVYIRGKSILHVDQLEKWAFGTLDGFRRLSADESEDHNEAVVKRTQQYISANLDKDLSLAMLANQVYLHPNHLSKLFKQATGATISHYIYEERMRLASQLLKRTEDKVYHIGLKVGYPNTNWFIKKFREYFNLTPQEYRERARPRID